MEYKPGDCVELDYAWPGPDTTHLIIREIRGAKLWCWDLWFHIEIEVKATEVRPMRRSYPEVEMAIAEARKRFGLARD